MTRSSNFGELNFDPEIEKTTRRLRKETRQARQIARTRATTSKIEQASPGLNLAIELGFSDTSSESDIEIEEMAA